jgi:hypothetical protein
MVVKNSRLADNKRGRLARRQAQRQAGLTRADSTECCVSTTLRRRPGHFAANRDERSECGRPV